MQITLFSYTNTSSGPHVTDSNNTGIVSKKGEIDASKIEALNNAVSNLSDTGYLNSLEESAQYFENSGLSENTKKFMSVDPSIADMSEAERSQGIYNSMIDACLGQQMQTVQNRVSAMKISAFASLKRHLYQAYFYQMASSLNVYTDIKQLPLISKRVEAITQIALKANQEFQDFYLQVDRGTMDVIFPPFWKWVPWLCGKLYFQGKYLVIKDDMDKCEPGTEDHINYLLKNFPSYFPNAVKLQEEGKQYETFARTSLDEGATLIIHKIATQGIQAWLQELNKLPTMESLAECFLSHPKNFNTDDYNRNEIDLIDYERKNGNIVPHITIAFS